ncbi:MAG: SDR family oxidoreductase [Gemmatimonadota bacterium]|nr:SDR family oxidoreductase [Gemmatimonadota bacterium]
MGGWGRIVNVAAIVGIVGGRELSAYAAAEHAVVGFTKAIAKEAEGTGVTVNAVCPGYVDTPLTDETVARRMQRTSQLWQEAMDSILEESGQPRLIRAEEVAEVIMPLLSEDASETNGQLVVIDGKDSP